MYAQKITFMHFHQLHYTHITSFWGTHTFCSIGMSSTYPRHLYFAPHSAMHTLLYCVNLHLPFTLAFTWMHSTYFSLHVTCSLACSSSMCSRLISHSLFFNPSFRLWSPHYWYVVLCVISLSFFVPQSSSVWTILSVSSHQSTNSNSVDLFYSSDSAPVIIASYESH